MIYKDSFTVTSFQMDMYGKVTVPVLCGMMQETASRYCYENSISLSHLNSKNLTWMIVRQYVEFSGYPGWMDKINVSTWPRNKKGLRALRDYIVTDADGGILAKSTTTWILIDTVTKRPVRINETVDHIEALEDEKAFETEKSVKIDFPDIPFSGKDFNVRYSDLDLNGHVNNIKYIEWCLDSVPAEFQKSNIVENLSIEFMQETYADDTVSVKTAFQDGCFYHELVNMSSGETVCRAAMNWKGTAPF